MSDVTIETQAAKQLKLRACGDAGVNFNGDFGVGSRWQLPSENLPEAAELAVPVGSPV